VRAFALLAGWLGLACVGCEINVVPDDGVRGGVAFSVGSETLYYDASDADPRGLRVACERYGQRNEVGDAVHIGFADPRGDEGRVTGFDLVVTIAPGVDPAVESDQPHAEAKGAELLAWNAHGAFVGTRCEITLDGYDPGAGYIAVIVDCASSRQGDGSTGPPVSYSGELDGCAL
jgi:hypothetical protein